MSVRLALGGARATMVTGEAVDGGPRLERGKGKGGKEAAVHGSPLAMTTT
jgi:hypothetical protein